MFSCLIREACQSQLPGQSCKLDLDAVFPARICFLGQMSRKATAAGFSCVMFCLR